MRQRRESPRRGEALDGDRQDGDASLTHARNSDATTSDALRRDLVRRALAAQPDPLRLAEDDGLTETLAAAWWRAERLSAEEMIRACWRESHPGWTERDWWDAPLRDEVRALLWLPAGPGLATALAEVRAGPTCPHPHDDEATAPWPTPGRVAGWPCACMVVLAAAWEACGAWANAGAARALVDAMGGEPASFTRPGTGRTIQDPACEELAHALRVTPNSMANRASVARSLVAHPPLLALVSSGAISAWAARLVTLETATLTDAQAREVVEHVCGKVRDRLATGRRAWTSAEVGRAARMARRRICPDSDRPARERAYAQRSVRVHDQQHGMAVLIADLDATDAHRIHRRLSSIAAGLAAPDEPRNRDQLRADILTDLLLGSPAASGTSSCPGEPGSAGTSSRAECDGHEGDASQGWGQSDGPSPAPDHPSGPVTSAAHSVGPPSPRPDINVIVSLDTVLGLDDQPGEVPGLGPIPASLARALAADGRWHAWITDAAGSVTATGNRGYVPSAGLARLIRAREPYCRMPGCRQAATRCDLDHVIPYPTGQTSPANLGPLCRRHHIQKTHGGWDLQPAAAPGSGAAGSEAGPTGPAGRPGSPPGEIEPGAAPAWRWHTPAGFTITDHADAPLEVT